MKRHILFTAILFLLTMTVQAQVGIGTESPNNAAELDIVSPGNNTGVLIPIFTDTEISTNLSTNTPPHGSLIYNTSKTRFMYNAGTATIPQWTFVGQAPLSEDVTAISTPFEGDLRYDKATNTLRFYNGSVWKTLIP